MRKFRDFSTVLLLITLTFLSTLSSAKAREMREVIVLFPTPPFPERTRILYFTEERFAVTRANPGSACFVAPDAHTF